MNDLMTPSERFGAYDAVPPPRAGRILVRIVILLFLSLPVVLTTVPWVQNVPGAGKVTALDPVDRTQVIPAPVSGRLVQLHVREGSHVERGEILAEMADQDPQYAVRLEQQTKFARDKVQAAKDQVDFYTQQLIHLEDSREQAISTAQYELNAAIEKVTSEEQDLEAAEADADQKRADRERKWRLYQQQIASELDFQRAESAALAAKAKVESHKAKVKQARASEKAKMASMGKIGADLSAKLESTKSLREEARGKVNTAEKEYQDALTKLERQKTQVVVAPRRGTILRVYAAQTADLLSQGQPLIELIPDEGELAVELWVRGVDAPLIEPGRKVRLQFEGWPAVQFAGWPSVAVGTFGGEVAVVDALGASDGRFRTLIVPDPDDAPWPDRPFLRQGVRTQGWLLLDEVSLGYEIWRQLNAFPPALRSGPPEDAGVIAAGAGGGKKSSGSKEKSK